MTADDANEGFHGKEPAKGFHATPAPTVTRILIPFRNCARPEFGLDASG